MRRTPMPSRVTPLLRSAPLQGGTPPGRVVPLRTGLARNTPVRKVSARRARENRERAAMADRLWPDRREGTVMCTVPECPRKADDLHEPLTRARGGSITSEDNVKPVCRQHNDELTLEPEWGYRLGFLKHSWDAGNGGAA